MNSGRLSNLRRITEAKRLIETAQLFELGKDLTKLDLAIQENSLLKNKEVELLRTSTTIAPNNDRWREVYRNKQKDLNLKKARLLSTLAIKREDVARTVGQSKAVNELLHSAQKQVRARVKRREVYRS